MAESQTVHSAADAGSPVSQAQPGRELVRSLKTCARERPELVAFWCLAAGFVLGWKLKPW